MPACSSHGSEARIEGKGVRIGTGSGRRGEEGKKVRGFRGNHTEDNGNLPGPPMAWSPSAGVAD